MKLEPPRLAEGVDIDVATTGHRPRNFAGSAFVTVPLLVAAVRRRWRFWTTVAALGVAAAAGLTLVSPPPYSATTTLVLAHRNTADPSRAMVTEKELLETTTVARRAVDRLGLRVSATTFGRSYQGTVVTTDLLDVTARGTGASDAVRRADAVARSFLEFRADEAQRQSQLAIHALEDRVRSLEAELKDVNDRINSGPPDPSSDASVRAFGELLTRRSSLGGQLTQLHDQMTNLAADARSIRDNSRIVDPASVDPRSPLRALTMNVAAGLAAGLAFGVGWVVVAETASDRVRRRNDVAAALGAPVQASVGRLRGRARRQRRRFRQHLARPNEEITRMVRPLGMSLGPGGTARPGLVVVSVQSDWPAALAVAAAAAELARHGSRVLVADLSGESAVARVLDARDGDTAVLDVEIEGSKVVVAFPGKGNRYTDVDKLRKDADVVLSLVTLDPAVGAAHLAAWGTTALAVVTSGRSSATVLGSVSEMLSAAGLRLVGTILVGADRTDETTGISGWESSPSPVDISSVWTNG